MSAELSVVIPVYNEDGSVAPLHEELLCVLDRIGRPFEIIYVDDGSRDATFDALAKVQRADARVSVVRLARNYGQTTALVAGFERAAGEVIITLDADGQNDPADIPALLEALAGGCDLVTGWRRPRYDALVSRRLPSVLANAVIGRVTGVRLHDYGCGLKVFRREIARELRLYGELHRFIPALAAAAGGRVAELPVHHRPRRQGVSKYGLGRTLRVLLDLVTVKFLWGSSASPIQLFGSAGVVATLLGIAIVGALGLDRLVSGAALADRPLLWLGFLLTLGGLQLVAMGLLGELMIRTHHASLDRPYYRVAETLGAPREPPRLAS